MDLSAGTTNLELWMDFDDLMLGGSVDLAFSGPIGFGGFAPSEFFINGVDGSFSGHSGHTQVLTRKLVRIDCA